MGKYNINDYIGTQINSWFIIEFVEYRGKRNPYMRCRCNCGKEKIVNFYNLINNKTKDCGCGRKQMLKDTKTKYDINDFKNKRFGKLIVLSEDGKDKNNKKLYKCKCDCGNIVSVRSNSLLTGHAISCGCTTSINNIHIGNILNNLGYEYKFEKKIVINDLTVRFDIWVENLNLFIEYDGEQHFRPTDFAGKGIEWAIEQLKEIQYRDSIKDRYCFDNNIFLLRIPYTQKNNLEQIIKETINIITNND